MVYICRKEYFNAAHKLYNQHWTPAKNHEIFGVCANENWHGHNFELIVTVKGSPDPETGMVMDMKKLGKIIREQIIDKVDHKNLNLDVEFLQEKMPTCENLVLAFWSILEKALGSYPVKMHSIKLYETHKNFVEYYGEPLPVSNEVGA